MTDYATLLPGDPAPTFIQAASGNPRYVFDIAAGRYIVLCFFASSTDPQSRGAIDAIVEHRSLFDDVRASFYGVTLDPTDQSAGRVAAYLPGIRFFWDFDGKISRLYGAIGTNDDPAHGRISVRRFWLVLDPTLHVMAVIPFAPDGSDRGKLFAFLAALPPPDRFAGFEVFAPVLVLPNVFEPGLCQTLIASYERHGGVESGFMREIAGKTARLEDHAHKRRRDHVIEDQPLRIDVQRRFARRVLPEILKIHSFQVTRMERYIVSCYAAEDGGHFRAHRDNTTKGTAHRRFAVSVNLNADFDGGEVMFPEYGTRRYKPGIGAAIVFSCSLLHAVSKVTRGRRYAFLPFLYDDAAAKTREANDVFLADDVQKYRP